MITWCKDRWAAPPLLLSGVRNKCLRGILIVIAKLFGILFLEDVIAWLKHTFLLPSSFRSKAHCCLHCSQVWGGPYFFSELVQRWHLVPINAAIMLQYWQGLGWKINTFGLTELFKTLLHKTQSVLVNIWGVNERNKLKSFISAKYMFQVKNGSIHSIKFYMTVMKFNYVCLEIWPLWETQDLHSIYII